MNKFKRTIDGFEDYGSRGKTNYIADHALVFMVQGLNKKWTQPIAFYFVHRTCPTSMLKNLICDVVRAVRDAGFNILETLSYLGPTNRGAISELKATSPDQDEIFYEIDGHRVVHLWDTPDAFKNIRNNLLSSDLEYEPGKVAKWKHIIEYFKLDESLCKMSKASEKHLKVNIG